MKISWANNFYEKYKKSVVLAHNGLFMYES